MLKRSFFHNSVLLCAISGLTIVYLLFNPQIIESVLSNPLYGYSALPFLVSIVLVWIIVSKSSYLSPSLFVLLFFMTVPLLGSASTRQYFDHVGSYYGRRMPSFDFPLFLWSVGTASFFCGVLFGWRLLRTSSSHLMVAWDHRRMTVFLSCSLILACVGTILAFHRIGYVPLLKFGISDVRFDYFKTVGPLASRFAQHWPVPALLSSMLFFLESGKKRYIYFCITIICAMGAMFYAQRTA